MKVNWCKVNLENMGKAKMEAMLDNTRGKLLDKKCIVKKKMYSEGYRMFPNKINKQIVNIFINFKFAC